MKGKTDGEALLTFENIKDLIRLQFAGFQLDYEACYDEFGQNIMRGLAEFAINIRDEFYAGKMDALKVMASYCRDNKVLDGHGLSPSAKTLSNILESI